MYGDIEGYITCVVEGFSAGSIIASFRLDFAPSSQVTATTLMEETQSYLNVNDGKIEVDGTELTIDKSTIIIEGKFKSSHIFLYFSSALISYA